MIESEFLLTISLAIGAILVGAELTNDGNTLAGIAVAAVGVALALKAFSL